jgi:hypothetical protein
VRRIDYQTFDGNPQVTIVLDWLVAYDAHRLDYPDRVYVDLHDARPEPKIAGRAVFANTGNRRLRSANLSLSRTSLCSSRQASALSRWRRVGNPGLMQSLLQEFLFLRGRQEAGGYGDSAP